MRITAITTLLVLAFCFTCSDTKTHGSDFVKLNHLSKRSPEGDGTSNGGGEFDKKDKTGEQDDDTDHFGIRKFAKKAHDHVVKTAKQIHDQFVKAAKKIHDKFVEVAKRVQAWFAGIFGDGVLAQGGYVPPKTNPEGDAADSRKETTSIPR